MASEWVRAFRVLLPGGGHWHGAQFPSGRCVVDNDRTGLVDAATDIHELRLPQGARIEWQDLDEIRADGYGDGYNAGYEYGRGDG